MIIYHYVLCVCITMIRIRAVLPSRMVLQTEYAIPRQRKGKYVEMEYVLRKLTTNSKLRDSKMWKYVV